MASTAKAIFGGLLSGAGTGMVARAEQMREDALLRAQNLREDRQIQEQRDYQQGRDEQDRTARRGLLSQIDTDREGNRIGITAGGDTKELGYQAPLAEGDIESGAFGMMTAGEKRTYDEIKASVTDPNTSMVDWQALVGRLRNLPAERAGGRWNEIADLLTGAVGATMSREDAADQAEQEARGRRGIGAFGIRFGEEGFPNDDRSGWVNQRTEEIMMGREPASPGGARTGAGRSESPGSSTPAGGAQAANSPPGAGTQADPFQASSQAHVDWFRDNAPAGAIIRVNGEMFTK